LSERVRPGARDGWTVSKADALRPFEEYAHQCVCERIVGQIDAAREAVAA
jgi:hypothetical protein